MRTIDSTIAYKCILTRMRLYGNFQLALALYGSFVPRDTLPRRKWCCECAVCICWECLLRNNCRFEHIHSNELIKELTNAGSVWDIAGTSHNWPNRAEPSQANGFMYGILCLQFSIVFVRITFVCLFACNAIQGARGRNVRVYTCNSWQTPQRQSERCVRILAFSIRFFFSSHAHAFATQNV